MKFDYTSILGKKLLIRILWVSSCITLILTALQLSRDYNVDVNQINTRLNLIEQSNLHGIINNLWTFNIDVLQVQIDGIQRIQDVEYVAIVSPAGKVIQHTGQEITTKKILRKYPMVYVFEGEAINIGELHVVASLTNVYKRIEDKAIIILLTQGVKTFIVSAFILFIVQLLVTSPIIKLSSYARLFRVTDADTGRETVLPERLEKLPDEITDLYQSFESMRQNLLEAYRTSEKSLKRFQQIFDGTNDSIIMVDLDSSRIIEVNQTAAKMLEYNYEELVGMKATAIHPDEINELYEFFNNVVLNESYRCNKLSCQTKSGEKIPAEISASIIMIDNRKVVLAMVRDNREQSKIRRQLQHIAFHDTLTGLPNRLLLTDRLEITLAHAKREKNRCCLIYLDLDNFKTINDSLGHNIGDQLLKQFSKRVLMHLRHEDTFARLGGDEFVLLSSNNSQSIKEIVNSASKLIDKISKATATPFKLAGKEIETSYSAGISIFPDNGTTVDELLKNADTAMYRAKNLGRNQAVFFTKELADVMNKKLMIQTALGQAMEQNEFELAYQAKVDPATNRVTGAEVLLRWQSKELGFLSPMEFIPILEDSGQIIVIDKWVMRKACTEWKQAIDDNIIDKDLQLSINVSGKQFNTKNFVKEVKAIVESSHLSPENIEIEVTERSLLKNINEAEVVMEELVKYGIDFALDDFGTGYSSLSYLHRLPVQTLKIDRSFTVKIAEESKPSRMICSIIQMAHQLGLNVVAEGVETAKQQKFLLTQQCDTIQGFFHSKPLKWSLFCEFVKARNSNLTGVNTLRG